MRAIKETALVYCEKQFGLLDGKTATGLIRHSEKYTIVGVIDSSLAGKDTGKVLHGKMNGIPIFKNLDDALSKLIEIPDCFIYGKAPLEACISADERGVILNVIDKGMDIINGLHQFFSDDIEFADKAVQNDIQIRDIRKPPKLKDLHVFTGKISRVTAPVIAVLGTDCACGKRTTAVELNHALNNLGLKSILVATGQSGLMQGAKYGVAIDALISQFVIGEIENCVVQAFDNENPDIILVEGQSAASHPAFMGSLGILKGSMPDGIILQHPPARKFRCDFPHLPMPTVFSEIELLEAVTKEKVLAITLNHENLSDEDVLIITEDYEKQLRLPVSDVLIHGCQPLIQTLFNHFPELSQYKSENIESISGFEKMLA